MITHTPGTRAGDRAELQAIKTVFSEKDQCITTNKWMFGHTLGASGALSLQFSLHIFNNQFVPFYYPTTLPIPKPFIKYKRILINTAGFGGKAASIILSQI
ncbi:hypothetical protein [Pontibacter aydingkolensis]|uniref:hypothetical protein n=1 Tax=Pontibacter aydingkolensis TaxID=1911536 RepID=UPI00339B94D2